MPKPRKTSVRWRPPGFLPRGRCRGGSRAAPEGVATHNLTVQESLFMSRMHAVGLSLVAAVGLASGIAEAQPAYFFSTGEVDGLMAVASRPASPTRIEI